MSCGLAAKRPHSDYECDETDSPLAVGIKRLRLQHPSQTVQHVELEQEPAGSGGTVVVDGHSAASCASKPLGEDSPQFTLRQVKLICERALKEQEQRLRHEFEVLLNKRLEEQEVAYSQHLREQLGAHAHPPNLSYIS